MAITDYSKILFLKDYSYGAVAETRWNTDIISTQDGSEKRNGNWIEPLMSFDITYSAKKLEIARYIKEFFDQHYGNLITFKFKDWSDYKCEKSRGFVNAGDGLNGKPYANLYKKYQASTLMDGIYKKINVIAQQGDELKVSPFKLYFDNVQQTSGFSVDYDYGRVYFDTLSESNIVSITQASNGVVITSTNHGFSTNDKIYISEVDNGNNKINDRVFTITKINDTSFSINSSTLNFGSLTNGKASKYPQDSKIIVNWEGDFYYRTRFEEQTISITFTNYDIFDIPTKIVEVRVKD